MRTFGHIQDGLVKFLTDLLQRGDAIKLTGGHDLNQTRVLCGSGDNYAPVHWLWNSHLKLAAQHIKVG
ncbi:MAG: hypothetical protein HS126_00160 [Anaerolineales bacterium]|nr:hypothetical protein [Anaerolineales bacterium]